MNSRYFLFILSTFFCLSLKAQQEVSPSQRYIGIKAGFTNCTLKNSPFDASALLGLNIGAVYFYAINKNFSFQAEPGFIQKGFTEKNDLWYYPSSFTATTGTITGFKFINRYSYVELPLLFNAYLVNKKIILGISAGLNPTIFISGKSTLIDNGTYNSSEKIKSKVMNFDLLAGGVVGLTLSDKYKLLVAPRMGLGLTRVFKESIGKEHFQYFNLSAMLLYQF